MCIVYVEGGGGGGVSKCLCWISNSPITTEHKNNTLTLLYLYLYYTCYQYILKQTNENTKTTKKAIEYLNILTQTTCVI